MVQVRKHRLKDSDRFHVHSEELIGHARALRRDMTDAERRLWAKLSHRQTGHRFRRQHPIHHYIADFACIGAKLVIELDGGQHATALAYDAKRSAILEQLGYRVLRFSNQDVLLNLEAVYIRIVQALEARTESP